MKSTLMTASLLILVVLFIIDYASVYAEFIDGEISLERERDIPCFETCMKLYHIPKLCYIKCRKH
uniref:Potassium channel toxin kappa-KTx 4.1 n=1 Tax=Heterometrus petersii TaxID=754296 RepID=KKX41_HETPE|nr:RecName: Full=Potassium channel toxin kappa-KTx 4.1; AltName: Full=HSP040C.2; Flags: Precursor [Heterometrus petersii]